MVRDFDQSALVMFARELQAARAKAGMSQELLATKINYSPSLVGMVEGCRRVPGRDFAQRCDQVFSTTGTFARMQEHLRAVPFPVWFRPFVEYEARATVLRGFEHVLVPGLAQTAGYARAVLATQPNTTEERVEEFVTARLERQVILDRDEPPLLWLVIDETVLHREVGGAKVMHDQLVHLAELSERPNITVEVIPDTSGAHSGLLGAFAIAEFGDAPSVVYLETVAGGQIAEERSVVARVTLIFDTLRSEALPRGASRDLIRKAAEERWT